MYVMMYAVSEMIRKQVYIAPRHELLLKERAREYGVTEAELIEHCRSMLARFKAPKKVIFGELPKTSTGKIQKFVLRERARSVSAIE